MSHRQWCVHRPLRLQQNKSHRSTRNPWNDLNCPPIRLYARQSTKTTTHVVQRRLLWYSTRASVRSYEKQPKRLFPKPSARMTICYWHDVKLYNIAFCKKAATKPIHACCAKNAIPPVMTPIRLIRHMHNRLRANRCLNSDSAIPSHALVDPRSYATRILRDISVIHATSAPNAENKPSTLTRKPISHTSRQSAIWL